ncbi:hemolysin family protein [Stomatohabitans albus]|uniref:hemolysin family protein n=1 Tax=Stomatohabitans albus TaxID=3110766 RepID=UPI00300DBA62
MDQLIAWLLVGLIVVLVVANGYFVAQEFAFVAVKRAQVEGLAQSGDPSGKRILFVLKRLSFMLSGAQLGITITSLVIGFITDKSLGTVLTPVAMALGLSTDVARAVALVTAFVIATCSQMILGELFPKNLAIAKPLEVSKALSRSTIIWLTVAKPFIALFDGAANALIRALGVEPIHELDGGASAEELDHIAHASQVSGELNPELVDLFSRAINFQELDAGAVAVERSNLVVISPTDRLEILHGHLGATGLSRYPVVDRVTRLPLGVIDIGALLRVPRDQWGTVRVKDMMHPVPAVPDTARLSTVLATLRDRGSHVAVVINEHGGFSGMLTLEDLIEELVGEILDEHDDALIPTITASGDGKWTVAGQVRVDEVERETGLSLPRGDYDTIAGLFVAHLGRLGREGDIVRMISTDPKDPYANVMVTLMAMVTTPFTTETLALTILPIAAEEELA